jgi:hypothetical protein
MLLHITSDVQFRENDKEAFWGKVMDSKFKAPCQSDHVHMHHKDNDNYCAKPQCIT